MRFIFFILSSLLFLTACGGGGKSSQAKFEISFNGVATGSMSGGLIIYGTNATGTEKFTRVILNPTAGNLNANLVEELPRGVWKFGAVGWMGARAFEGEIRCAFSSSVLSGDSATVSLTLSNARCFQSDVAIPATYNAATPQAFGSVTSSFCEGGVSTKSSSRCSYSPATKPTPAGFVGSYEILVAGGRINSKGVELFPGEVLKSNCYRVGSDAEPVGTPTYVINVLNIPAFLPQPATPFKVRAFLSDDCSAGKGSFIRSMGNPDEVKLATYSPGYNYLHVSASMSDVCAANSSSVSGPASGLGTPGYPWVICTEEQLLWVQKNFASAAVNSGNYILGKDLDLAKFLKAGNIGANPADQCLPNGDTFVPIGAYYTSYPTCTWSNHSPVATFAFDGNGKKISHFRFSDERANSGFFDELYGKVYDITFDRASVRGSNNSGIVIGTATAATLHNIKVTNSEFEGREYSGAILGDGQGAMTLNQLHVQNTSVRGGLYTGGVVGFLDSGTFQDSSFEGRVYSDNNNYIGGIVGKSLVNVYNAFSSGILLGRGMNMGGVAGSAPSVMYVGSDMFIQDQNSATFGTRNIGGLIGDGSTVSRSYFRGKIRTACNSGCAVGSLSGNSATSVPFGFTIAGEGMALGGRDGDTANYSLTAMSSGISFLNDICLADGASCRWLQSPGDFPRLMTHPDNDCRLPANNATVTAQDSVGRGTQSNPIIICKRSQLSEVGLVSDKYFVQKQNIYGNVNMSGVNLVGKYDGGGYVIYGFETNNDGTSSALFDQIGLNSEFKNSILAGFKNYESSACSTCKESVLARANYGVIKKVYVAEADIKANHIGAEVAGLVNQNFGTVSEILVSGSLKNNSKIAGIVYVNDGVVQDSHAKVMIDLQNSNSAVGTGGIVGMNRNSVIRNSFGGEIKNIAGGGSARIGGIVGHYTYGGNIGAGVIDNLVTEDAVLYFSTSVTDSGGIVGLSDNSSNIIARNINYGFVFNQSSETTIRPILGSGLSTNVINSVANLNYALNTHYNNFDILSDSISAFSNSPTPGTCRIVFSTQTADGTPVNSAGAINVPNMGYFMGSMSRISSKTYELLVPLEYDRCNSLHGLGPSGFVAYDALMPPATPSTAALKASRYDVRDLSISADADVALAAYKNIILGLAATPPVWIVEEGEGIKLFNNN